jgi:hypothetical protein
MNIKRKNLLVLATVVLMLVLAVSTALGAGGTKSVGVVVQHSDGTVVTKVVTVPEDASTFDILKAAKLNMVSSQTKFGPAVCALDAEGCTDATNCFCDKKHFWAFYILKGDKWEASQVGVGGYKPKDHEVVGFAWSTFDANYKPEVQPPVYTFDKLAGAAQNSTKRAVIEWIAFFLIAIVAIGLAFSSPFTKKSDK